jgi:RNA polymerase sigma-54 factor
MVKVESPTDSEEEILDLIEEENKNSPLSDQEIQELLEKKEMKVSRRTVGNTESSINILPSHLRKSEIRLARG